MLQRQHLLVAVDGDDDHAAAGRGADLHLGHLALQLFLHLLRLLHHFLDIHPSDCTLRSLCSLRTGLVNFFDGIDLAAEDVQNGLDGRFGFRARLEAGGLRVARGIGRRRRRRRRRLRRPWSQPQSCARRSIAPDSRSSALAFELRPQRLVRRREREHERVADELRSSAPARSPCCKERFVASRESPARIADFWSARRSRAGSLPGPHGVRRCLWVRRTELDGRAAGRRRRGRGRAEPPEACRRNLPPPLVGPVGPFGTARTHTRARVRTQRRQFPQMDPARAASSRTDAAAATNV